MFHFRRSWLGWLLFAIYLSLLAGTFLLAGLNSTGSLSNIDDIGLVVTFGIFAAVGSLIAARQPSHAIAWLFYTAGIGGLFSAFGAEYAYYTLLTNPGSLPGGVLIGGLSNISWALIILIFIFLPLLFPTGSPPSRRWRWVGWLGGISWVTIISALFFGTSTISFGEAGALGEVPNPLALPGAEQALERIGIAAYFSTMLAAVLSAISLIFRYRGAALQERLQIKWFTYAILLLIGWWAFGEFYGLTGGEIPPLLSDLSFPILMSLLPATTAIGILKYRLYEIDLIIRRTLVYGLVTATLGLVYFGAVTLLQNLFTAISGQGSQVAIVLSTLTIAALFTPLRRRIQDSIDRRFYRRKYDAEKALAAFGLTVRDEVDLESLSRALLRVVDESMRPQKLSLWLIETESGGSPERKSIRLNSQGPLSAEGVPSIRPHPALSHLKDQPL